MKTSNNNKARQAVVTLLAVLFVSFAFAQDNTVKYRVTAYKKGDKAVSSVSNVVEVMPALALYVPNTFTPNNDGLNDTFGAVGEGMVEYKMMVYNVWGNLVFESSNPNAQWDGKYQGYMCAEGAYTYMIVAKGENNKVKKSGTVNLLM